MTMRFGISSEPMRAGVSRIFMGWLSAAGEACSRGYALEHRDLAAVQVHGRAVQPRRARGDDEGDEVGHVLDGAVSYDAGFAAELGADFCLRLPRPLALGADTPPLPLCFDERGVTAIDPDAVILAEIRQTFCKGGDRGIDRAADRELLLRLASARPRDCDKRAAAFLEERPSRTRKPHMGKKFQRVAVFPVRVGQREKIAALRRACIVDENVEAAEFLAHGFDQRLRRARLAQIECAYGTLALLSADRLRHVFERFGVAGREHEVAPLVGQSQGNATADATTRTSDERDLPLKSKLHLETSCLPRRVAG